MLPNKADHEWRVWYYATDDKGRKTFHYLVSNSYNGHLSVYAGIGCCKHQFVRAEARRDGKFYEFIGGYEPAREWARQHKFMVHLDNPQWVDA